MKILGYILASLPFVLGFFGLGYMLYKEGILVEALKAFLVATIILFLHFVGRYLINVY